MRNAASLTKKLPILLLKLVLTPEKKEESSRGGLTIGWSCCCCWWRLFTEVWDFFTCFDGGEET